MFEKLYRNLITTWTLDIYNLLETRQKLID